MAGHRGCRIRAPCGCAVHGLCGSLLAKRVNRDRGQTGRNDRGGGEGASSALPAQTPGWGWRRHCRLFPCDRRAGSSWSQLGTCVRRGEATGALTSHKVRNSSLLQNRRSWLCWSAGGARGSSLAPPHWSGVLQRFGRCPLSLIAAQPELWSTEVPSPLHELERHSFPLRGLPCAPPCAYPPVEPHGRSGYLHMRASPARSLALRPHRNKSAPPLAG